MEPVAMIIVGGVIALLVVVFLWSAVRGVAGSRVRGPLRDDRGLDLPHGLSAGLQEPGALRAPFALTGRGEVVDVGQAWIGTFRGGQLGLVDLHIRTHKGAAPTAHTLVTIDVEQRWPWVRINDREVVPVEVDVPAVDVAAEVAGSGRWLVQAQDAEVAARMLGAELLRWLSRSERPLVVEFTPRHVLVAAVGRVPDAELTAFVELAVGVVDHVPADLREQLAVELES